MNVFESTKATSFIGPLVMICMLLVACKKGDENSPMLTPDRITQSIRYNGVNVDVVIDKPALPEVDVLLVFHGTVLFDNKILEAANNTLDAFKRILDKKDVMIVSVAYPEENLLIGDNVVHAEAALLWVKNNAGAELGVKVRKVFLAGHSQGAYIVTRLNTMHPTDGVIANAPGPLNLVYRCQLEENGNIPSGITCTLFRNSFGSTSVNPSPYSERSLLKFTSGYLSDILFTQGLEDSPIQMYSWPTFKNLVTDCTDCQEVEFLDIDGEGHNALFSNETAKAAFNAFIESR